VGIAEGAAVGDREGSGVGLTLDSRLLVGLDEGGKVTKVGSAVGVVVVLLFPVALTLEFPSLAFVTTVAVGKAVGALVFAPDEFELMFTACITRGVGATVGLVLGASVGDTVGVDVGASEGHAHLAATRVQFPSKPPDADLNSSNMSTHTPSPGVLVHACHAQYVSASRAALVQSAQEVKPAHSVANLRDRTGASSWMSSAAFGTQSGIKPGQAHTPSPFTVAPL
jgi:hypothetical protein